MDKRKYRWSQKIGTRTGRIALAGYLTIAVFIGGFGVWAIAAPLAGAVVAPGIVAAAGNNIKIQSLEGGIIRKALTNEGQRVSAGDPLLILDSTMAESDVNRLLKQLVALRAQAQRLVAERDGGDKMTVPDDLMTLAKQADLTDSIEEERKEFQARLSRYKAEGEILNQRVQALKDAVEGLKSQKKAGEDQLEVVKDELERKKALLDKGLTNRSEYTALLRSQAELVGQIGSIESQIASSSTQTIEARQQIERAITSRVEQAATDLNTARASISDVSERLAAARAQLARTTIRSPADGIIVSMVYNSPGSVIRPGEPVIDLLPTTKNLIIEARVSPKDVDNIHIGQNARMRFAAFNARRTPEVAGSVFYLSADRLVDAKGQPYFTARLHISENLPAPITAAQIFPGMPVEAFISTDSRTFVEYLLQPLMDSFSHAFREE